MLSFTMDVKIARDDDRVPSQMTLAPGDHPSDQTVWLSMPSWPGAIEVDIGDLRRALDHAVGEHGAVEQQLAKAF
jgi:hypothetical protein